MRLGRVRAGSDDDEVDAGVALRHDGAADIGGGRPLGPSRPQPLRHAGVHPVDRRAGLGQRRDLGRCLADPQPPQCRARQRLAGAGHRVAETEHHHGPHLAGQAHRCRAAQAPGDRLIGVVGLVPHHQVQVHAAHRGRLGRGQFQPGHHQEGGARRGHREAGQPLGLVRVIPGQVAQIRPGGEQQRVKPGPGRGLGGPLQPARRVQVRRRVPFSHVRLPLHGRCLRRSRLCRHVSPFASAAAQPGHLITPLPNGRRPGDVTGGRRPAGFRGSPPG